MSRLPARVALAAATLWVCAVSGLPEAAAPRQSASPAPAARRTGNEPVDLGGVVRQYCGTCHSARAASAATAGGVVLALAAINGSAPVITALLDAGADARGRVGDGETVLMAAARTGRVDAARALLDRGADPDAREPWQRETALMWAAGENHAPMVQLLVQRGAELDARSLVPEFPKVKVDLATMVTTALPRGGLTALMLAARQGAGDGVLALIAAEAPLDAKDNFNRTPLDVAMGVPGGGRGRGGQAPGPGPVFKTTAALLKELMQ